MLQSQTRTAKVHLLALQVGEPLVASIVGYCGEHGIGAADVRAIGAIDEARLGAFDPAQGRYQQWEEHEARELLSLTGNVALLADGAPFLHAHVVLGDLSGVVVGGHLFEARCAVTVEVVITELECTIVRGYDEGTGLNLWKLDRRGGS
jgi:uncharacterized protein